MSAECAQFITQRARLRSRARNHNSFPEERPFFVPAKATPQRHNFSKHCHCRCFEIAVCSFFCNVCKHASERLLFSRCCGANKCHWQIAAHTLLEHFACNGPESFHTHQHDLCAAKLGQRGIINCACSLRWILV